MTVRYKKLIPGDKILVGDEWFNGDWDNNGVGPWVEVTFLDCFVGAKYKNIQTNKTSNT